MQKFSFRPERILKFRQTQLKTEEAKLETRRREKVHLLETMHLKERQLLDMILHTTGQTLFSASELNALESYRLRSDRECTELRAAVAQAEKDVEQQKTIVAAAQTGVRLLEDLRERRKVEWMIGQNRELEELAAEFTTAKWARQSNRISGGEQ